MQWNGFALQHLYKDAVILNGQKKKKKSKKKTLKCSTAQKHMTGFQLLADLLIKNFPFFFWWKVLKWKTWVFFSTKLKDKCGWKPCNSKAAQSLKPGYVLIQFPVTLLQWS